MCGRFGPGATAIGGTYMKMERIEAGWVAWTLGDRFFLSASLGLGQSLGDCSTSILNRSSAGASEPNLIIGTSGHSERVDYRELSAVWRRFGEARVSVTRPEAKIDRTFFVPTVSIRGTHTDVYDWDFEIDPNQAIIQAGFGTLHTSSARVFQGEVALDGEVTVGLSFRLGDPQCRTSQHS